MAKKTDVTTTTAKPIEVEDLTNLTLIEFGAENYKRVKAVRIRPKGALTVISGRNGQGKSSVLEAFLSLFEGKSGVAVKPIRVGEDQATSYAILGNDGRELVTVSQRIWNKKGGGIARELVITSADGRSFNSPQSIASALYAPIAFDPLEFQRTDDAGRVDVLKALTPGFNFADAASRRKAAFEDRTAVGRDRDRAEARAAAIVVSSDAPAERVDTAAVVQKLGAAADHNTAAAGARARRIQTEAALSARQDEIEAAEARLATLRRQAVELQAVIQEMPAAPATIDVSALQAQLEGAVRLNQLYDVKTTKLAARDEAVELSKKYDALTASIEAIDAKKKAAIAAAKLPVEGLEFDDDGVTLNGLPFEQASSAEQLRASALLAMATNPNLRVIVVREGSLLDSASEELLADMAAERNYSLLVEKVTDGQPIGIVIEDGEVLS